jgi:hypothetical protein
MKDVAAYVVRVVQAAGRFGRTVRPDGSGPGQNN